MLGTQGPIPALRLSQAAVRAAEDFEKQLVAVRQSATEVGHWAVEGWGNMVQTTRVRLGKSPFSFLVGKNEDLVAGHRTDEYTIVRVSWPSGPCV